MNIKKFFGLLMIFAVAIFAFTACSSDDDDEKVGTFEYAIGYPSFMGDFEGMQKINDAFMQAFGVTEKSFKLTGTQSECNRKAKEYAMKAQAALANEGSFGATVKFVNVTTGELIHSFTIEMDDNSTNPGHPRKRIAYEFRDWSITFKGIKGCRVKIEYKKQSETNTVYKLGFDGVIGSNEESIYLKSMVSSYHISVMCFRVSIWDEKNKKIGSFETEYKRGIWVF